MKTNLQFMAVRLFACLALFHLPLALSAASGTWNYPNSGTRTWTTATDWVGNVVPNGVGDSATIQANLGTAALTINLASGTAANRTLGSLTLGDPTATYYGYTIAAGVAGSQLVFDQTGVADATIDLPVTASTAANTISAGVTLNDNLVIGASTPNSGVGLTLSGAITDGANSYSIIKNGAGLVALTGAGSFDGGCIVNAGRLSGGAATSFGTGPVTVISGGQAFPSGAATYANAFTIAGAGFTEPSGDYGALRLGSSTVVSGTVTLSADSRIGLSGVTATISGNIGETGGARLLEIANVSTTANGTVTLSGNNTYSGGTTNRGNILAITSSTAFGGGPVTIVGNGTAARQTKLNLSGVTIPNAIYCESTAQTAFLGVITAVGGVTSTISGPITVKVGAGNGGHFASSGVGSTLRITGPIHSSGTGVPLLRVGSFLVSGGGTASALLLGQGNLKLEANNGLPTTAMIHIGSSGDAIIDLAGFNQTTAGMYNLFLTNQPSVFTNSAAATTSTLTLNYMGGTNLTFNGSINAGAGDIALVKSGPGTLTIWRNTNNPNGMVTNVLSYGGGTTVSQGALIVNHDTGSGTGTGTVTVQNTGMIGGTGTIGGALDVQAGGTLTGGTLTNIGTLNVNGAATLVGDVMANIAAGPGADLIKFNGGANLGGTLTVTGFPLVGGQTFNLFDGALSGTFSSVSLPGGPSHWNTTALYTTGEITFNNAFPTPGNFDLSVAVGGSATATVVGKYIPALDGDSEAVTIVAVSTPANGTATIIGGTNILYTSTVNAPGDSFTYTVSDGLSTAVATVTVTTFSPQGFNLIAGPTDVGGGQYQFDYLGIPGQQYAIDETASLMPPITWTPLRTNTAAGNGALNFTITPANPSGFFRTRSVP